MYFGRLYSCLLICFPSTRLAVPGFGPSQFSGPPGHMGAMPPGKAQVIFREIERVVYFESKL